MTKSEAIKFIKECANDSDAPYGFFVCAISREDIANHFEDEVVEEFDKLSKKKKRFCFPTLRMKSKILLKNMNLVVIQKTLKLILKL